MKIYCPFVGVLWKRRLIVLYKEIFRKSIHLCSGFVPLCLKISYPITIALLCFAGAFYTLTQILSLRGVKVPLVSDITDMAARERDRGKFVLGPLTLVAGILLAALLCPPKAAAVGILALAFGDGLASLAGKFLGNLRIPHTGGKTCAGSLMCFVAIFVSSFCVTGRADLSLAAALCGMFIEVLPLKDFDNILIPLLLGKVAQYF
ncbi:MAG: phosphatidate cytidylyltransferase [Treponema sp.]|nr:phosphatidate cytidylyltransferase [Treponema sp.]MEE3434956.1 phosphatidate cytidylyltransferase [Treponema sp.]